MIGRGPRELPFAEQVPLLMPLLRGPGAAPEMGEPGDAAALVDAALAHGLAIPLARAAETERIRLPADERRRLGRTAALRLARSRALRGELDAVAQVLADSGGPVPICVKGPALADRLYEDPDRRSFGDLDLIVPRGRLREAGGALEAAGWVEDVEFSADFAGRYGHELHLRRRRGGIWLHCELHWRIGDDAECESLDYELLAAGAGRMRTRPPVLTAAPAPELLMLCVHFIGDRERRLIWLEDIRRAAERASAEQWEECFELADRHGLAWALWRALDYSERYAGLTRARPDGRAEPEPPAFGPLRAVEELEMRASLHVGRLAQLRGRERLRYLRTVAVPTREGLEGTAGRDGVSAWRAVLRHLRTAAEGLRPRG